MSTRLQYLLDTNVLSETRRREAEPGVISFLSGVDPSALYLSVLSLGELRKGVALKKKADPDGAKKIAAWVDGLELSFADRVLGIDAATARMWGGIVGPTLEAGHRHTLGCNRDGP